MEKWTNGKAALVSASETIRVSVYREGNSLSLDAYAPFRGVPFS